MVGKDPWVVDYERQEHELQPKRETNMGRFASDHGGGTEFKQVNAGAHVARCVSIIDLGTQHGEYEGKPNSREQVNIRFELPFETDVFDGVEKPMIVGLFLTNSLGEKATMRKYLENWRARPFTAEELEKFDLNSILGKPCVVSVIHNAKGKAVVKGISALPKGTVCPPAVNPLSSFWIEEWDQGKFDSLPQFYQEVIAKSDEYAAAFGGTPSKGDAFEGPTDDEVAEDDVPF